MAKDDRMDVDKVRESLEHALRLQLGSLTTMTLLAGTLRGMRAAAVKAQLRDYVQAEVLAALHAVIAFSGQEPHSEALEHLLEQVIMRKQQQVEFLTLALSD